MISILLPFRNAESTIRATLASIRQQSYALFEVLAVNDNSADCSADLVKTWPDNRIRLVNSPGDGLVDALNYGLDIAKYDYIARIDADDLMRIERLRIQYGMLRQSCNLDLVSARASLFPGAVIANGYREYIRWQNQLISNTDIFLNRFVESPHAHPSVMFKKQSIRAAGGYHAGDFPEDYELWLRMMDLGMVMAKSPSVLLDWRESDSRLSRNHPAYRRGAFDRLRSEYLFRVAKLHERPVVFWGAGRKTRLRASHLINRGINPQRWIDIDPAKIGNKLAGIEVVAPHWLIKHSCNSKPFVLNYVTNHGARELIEQQLQQYGYDKGEDYLSVG